MDQKLSRAMLRMLKAREAVARRNVFFASIIYGARLVEGIPNVPGVMPTMCTDGINVYFDPNFVEQNDPYIEGILLHEVLHCALNHIGRCQHRKPVLWGQAIDYSVNPLVSSVYKLPVEEQWRGLEDPRFHDKSAEQIYEVLLKEFKEKQKQKGQGKGKGKDKSKSKPGDDESDGEGNGEGDADENDPNKPKSGHNQQPADPEQQEQNEREWRRIVANAVEKAEKAGQMHGHLKRLLDEIMPKEKIDWRGLIENMAHDAKCKVSGSWARPNRRYIGTGRILPGDTIEKVYRLVICLDVSGSVSDEMFKEMKGEVMNLLDQQIITHATVISTDTRVCNTLDTQSSEEVRTFASHGGGGTDFREAMRAVADVEEAVGCVFLTDMMTSSFGENPGIPVVWVDWNKSCPKPPYGIVVPY